MANKKKTKKKKEEKMYVEAVQYTVTEVGTSVFRRSNHWRCQSRVTRLSLSCYPTLDRR